MAVGAVATVWSFVPLRRLSWLAQLSSAGVGQLPKLPYHLTELSGAGFETFPVPPTHLPTLGQFVPQ